MANPRKFSEKIALLNQKQAEETAAFEAIMREVSDVTSRVRMINWGILGRGRRGVECGAKWGLLMGEMLMSWAVSEEIGYVLVYEMFNCLRLIDKLGYLKISKYGSVYKNVDNFFNEFFRV